VWTAVPLTRAPQVYCADAGDSMAVLYMNEGGRRKSEL
jgi:hypothetical protein